MSILADRLLPDALWRRIQPLLPPPPSHARGGAPRTVPDRACMAAILFMARASTPWALLPVAEFGCGSVTSCWRRFAEWAHAGVFERLHEVLLDELGAAGLLDWSRVSVDSVSLRATRGGTTRGPRWSRPRGSSDRASRCRALPAAAASPAAAATVWSARAWMYVNGRRVRTVRGRGLRAPIQLVRLARGRVGVMIVARTSIGRTTCAR